MLNFVYEASISKIENIRFFSGGDLRSKSDVLESSGLNRVNLIYLTEKPLAL
ncbi:MAG: hypothetical protein BAJALOKI3v1_10142 [Promethearchaeota archaeon]|nr:MAG: hypothetical protein BAJALOKI3v1_10142 [Candidatus Lokiarchaeota archaeon]